MPQHELINREIDLAWEEHKLVQGKIDKIGDFSFKVRGWATTLVTGLVVSAASNKVDWYVFLAGFPVVSAFQLLDHQQQVLRRALTKRAQASEVAIKVRMRRLARATGKPKAARSVFVPNVAGEFILTLSAPRDELTALSLGVDKLLYPMMYFMNAIALGVACLSNGAR